MPDMPGRTEFSAEEERQLRDQRRDAAYASLPLSRNIEDRTGDEPAAASLAQARAAYVVGRKGRWRPS